MRIIVAIIATFLPLMLSAQSQFNACRKLLELEDTARLVDQAAQVLKSKKYTSDQDAAGLYTLLMQVNPSPKHRPLLQDLQLSFPKSPFIQLLSAEIDPGLSDSVAFEKKITNPRNRTSKNPISPYLLAHLYWRSGKQDQALNTLKSALRSFPADYLLRITLAEFYLRNNQGTLANSELETVLFYHKNEPYPSYLLALVHQGSLRSGEAIEVLEKLLDTHPEFLPAYPTLFKLQMNQNGNTAAKNTFRRYQEIGQPGKTQSLQYLVLLVSYKQYEEAIQMGEALAKSYPDEPLVLKILAIAHFERSEFDLAVQYYEKAAPLNGLMRPDDYQRWVSALLKLEQEVKAVDLLKSLSGEARSTESVMLLGDLLMKRQAFSEASLAYKEVLSAKPDEAKAVFGLGRAFYYMKSYEEASKVFPKLDTLFPDSHLPPLWMARSLAGLDPETTKGLAKPHYEQFIERTNGKVNKMKAELSEAWSYLGYYYIVKNDPTTARKAWEKVRSYDPENKQAAEALKILRP